MKMVEILLHFKVIPILVFDGANLPSKSETEKNRKLCESKFFVVK